MRKPAILQALADPPVALLWAGLAASSFGEQLFVVVLNWVAADAFGTAAGYLSSLQAASGLLATLFLSPRTDGRNPIAVMIGTHLARAVALAIVAVSWLIAGQAQAWALALCVAVLAGGLSVFRPSMQASLPVLARSPAQLPAVNALLDTTDRLARMLGPAIVGLASGLVAMVHFVTIDIACFLASAAMLVGVRRMRRIETPPGSARPALEAMLRGARVVLGHPELGFLLRWWGVVNGAWYAALFVGLPLMIQRVHPGPEGLADFGLVISCYGGANLLTTLIIGSRPLPRRPGLLIFTGNLCLGTGIVIMGAAGLWAPAEWLLVMLCTGSVISATGGPMQDITVATIRQTQLPRQDLPAAVRAFMAVNSAGMLITLAAVPSLFNWLGVGQCVIAGGMLYVLAGASGIRRFWR